MENHDDILLQISEDNIQNLCIVLKEDFPRSIVAYNFLLTQLRWSHEISEVHLKVVCPNGEWQRGMVVALVSGLALEGKQYGVVYARSGDESYLSEVLHSTRVIPWRDLMQFGGILERHVNIVHQAALAAGVTPPPLEKQPPLFHLVVYPKLEELTKPSDIPGVRVSRLTPRDLEDMWRLRPIYKDYYKPVISACLGNNFSWGAWVQKPQDGEELVSIILQSEYGGLGMGQTHPNYMRRGLSQLILYHALAALHEAGIQPFAWTAVNNEKTLNYANKYHALIVDKCMRFEISPQSNCETLKGSL